MEVVAAVASVIAIGQAVAAIPEIVKVLKSTSKARTEIAHLAVELERLDMLYEHMKANIDLFTSIETPPQLVVSEPPYLRSLRTHFEAFIEQLRNVVDDLSTGKDNDDRVITPRFKWLFRRKKVVKLREECRALRHELESLYKLFSDKVFQ
ncbi:hypothetical protein F4677DRAFT_458935 [Hypoxylon crocopeplum]|nr:hypothetical protein F4677DRAFT_458935 [Hypoxylon crocopeplum]